MSLSTHHDTSGNKKIKKGEILEVIASDPEAWHNIDIWLTKSGDEFLDVETKKSVKKEGNSHIELIINSRILWIFGRNINLSEASN